MLVSDSVGIEFAIIVRVGVSLGERSSHTKLLLDDLKNLLLVEFLRETLHSGQSLTSITL